MSTLLALDTATEACSVALLHDGKVTSHYEVIPRLHAQKLLPMIQQLLAERRFPDFSSTEGKATQGQVEFIWRQEVSASPNYSFRRVEVKVFLPDAPDHAVAKLVSYVARQQ